MFYVLSYMLCPMDIDYAYGPDWSLLNFSGGEIQALYPSAGNSILNNPQKSLDLKVGRKLIDNLIHPPSGLII